MTQPYLRLRDRVDRLVAAVTARHADQLRCGPGCASCCQAGLTLVLVEAVVLGAELGLQPEQIHQLAGKPPLDHEGVCSLLDAQDRCRAYAGRPLVCRTQGMPLLYPAPTGATVCSENFTGANPEKGDFFDMTNLETALLAANMGYCMRADLDPLARVAIDRLIKSKNS
jgi:hypothetical protein